MASENEEPAGNFRDRLARIPKIEDQPTTSDPWEAAAPPVVRRPAPVARPQASTVAPVATPQAAPRYEEPVSPSFQPGLDDDDMYLPEVPRRRRRWPLVLAVLIGIAALVVLLPILRARQIFNGVERVPVAEILAPPPESGRNILLVGTDSRSGITADTDNAGVIIGGDEAITGERTDTIMVLRLLDDGSAKFLSLPRDLWLPINGGDPQRINTAFRDGPEGIINTVQSELNIPISHYVQVDLAGFIDLVDAVDGVEITIPYPAFDENSGLNLPVAGDVVLDSTQALAYVRSRFYTEIVDGVERRDPTSDIGRVQRQQAFMRALITKLSAQRDPRILDSMGTAMANAVVMDDGTTLTQAIEIANTLRATTPESVVLPTQNASIGGRSVLELTSDAPAVLAQFGGAG